LQQKNIHGSRFQDMPKWKLSSKFKVSTTQINVANENITVSEKKIG
jgi:hypothetical protein